MLSRWFMLCALVLLLSGLLAGCGRDERPPAEAATHTPQPPAAPTATVPPTTVPAATAPAATAPAATPAQSELPATPRAAAGAAAPGAAALPAVEPAALPVQDAGLPAEDAAVPALLAAAANLPRTRTIAVQQRLPDRLQLPAIELDIPVVELGWSTRTGIEGQVFSEWDVADFAAGWHKNSARPIEGGNVVLSGHNNIKGAVFRELDQLERGDRARLYVGDLVYEYIVDQVLIVPETKATPEQRRANAAWIEPTADNRLTLVSCWPRDDNTHRIIVVAHPANQRP